MTNQDLDGEHDLAGIKTDIEFISRQNGNPVAWRWYEEGYDHEPTDSKTTTLHESYVSHHEAPQFFGYIANNPALRGNFRGLNDFFDDILFHRTAALFTSVAATSISPEINLISGLARRAWRPN